MARYDAVTTDDSSGVQELIPDIVLPEVIATATEEEVFMPLVRRFDLTGEGAEFNIPQAGALAWGALTEASSGGPTETAFNTNARTLIPATHFVDVVVDLTTYNNTAIDLEAEIAKEAGIGLAQYRDGLAAALYAEAPAASPVHDLGANGTQLSYSTLIDGQELLYTQRAPRRNRFAWVVDPVQVSELARDNTLVDASKKGSPVMTGGVEANGYWTSVFDVDIYMSVDIEESTGLHSMMFVKNGALAYGYKRIMAPGKAPSEVMLDIEWDAKRRSVEINMTTMIHFEGAKGTSPTTNTWLVDIIS